MSDFLSGLEHGLQTTDWLKVAGVGAGGKLDPWFTRHLLGLGSGGYGATGAEPSEIDTSVLPYAPISTTDQQILSGGGLSTPEVHKLTTPATFGSPEELHGLRPWMPYILAGIGIGTVVVLVMRRR